MPELPKAVISLNQSDPHVAELEMRFKIDLYFLMNRLANIAGDYCAIGRLLFGPDLNVAIDDIAAFYDETQRLLSNRYSIIRKAFIKEEIQ